MTDRGRPRHGPTRFRWVIVGLLFAISAINFVDRAVLSFAITRIEAAFGLDNASVGLILGAFGLGYFVSTVAGGALVDRWGARNVLAISVCLWGVSMCGAGAAVGFASIYIARLSLGLAEGPVFPSINRSVANWLPVEERGRALSLTIIGIPIAIALSSPVITALIAAIGWRGAFIVLGLIGFLWLPFWLRLFRNWPESSDRVDAPERARIVAGREDTAQADRELAPVSGADWRFVVLNPTMLANNWSYFVLGTKSFFFITWLPKYLEQEYGMSLIGIGVFSVAPWGLGAALIWLLGDVSDRLYGKTGSIRVARTYPILVAQLVSALAILPLAFGPGLGMTMVLITIALAFAISPNPLYSAVCIDIAPRLAGTAYGVMNGAYAAAGFLAPSVTGFLVAHSGNYQMVFWLMALLGFSAVLALALFHWPDASARRFQSGS